MQATDPSPANDCLTPSDPPVLLAILIAARRTGDRLLETVARRELERHSITVRFRRPAPPQDEIAS